MSEISTKPYLLRAIHEWCSDSGYTPYISVSVDANTVVPQEFVRAGEIVLNVSLSATNRLVIGNELIEFQARFNGRAQDLIIPVENVSAIYARENGHGMAFEVPKALALVPSDAAAPVDDVAAVEPGDGPDGTVPTQSLSTDGQAEDTAAKPADGEDHKTGTADSSTPSDDRPLPLAVAGKRSRPTLAAVPDSGGQGVHHRAEPPSGSPPGSDPDGSMTDNGRGPPRTPRGRPTLTRIK